MADGVSKMQMAENDLLECSRFGELDNLKKLWSLAPELNVNAVDGSGNSALHMACGNGHLKVAKFLVGEKGARQQRNQAGSLPIHWALQNKHNDVIRFLLNEVPDVDVTERNHDGKTCITMAYASEDTEILQSVLEHKSAERLNKDGSVAAKGEVGDVDADAEEDPKQQQELVSLWKCENAEVRIREIGILSQVSCHEREQDDLKATGAFLWAASLILSKWIVDLKDHFDQKNVVELGCGCGLPGLVCAIVTSCEKVVLTDIESETWENTEHNVALNQHRKDALSTVKLDWKQKESELDGSADILIGSDLIYDLELVEPLLETVTRLFKKSDACNRTFFYVSADNDRAGLDKFVEAMRALNFDVSTSKAPAEYRQDPFGEGASFHIRFPEFEATEFTMYSFTATSNTQRGA